VIARSSIGSGHGDPLWSPSPERVERAPFTRFAAAAGRPRDYHELWRWSVEDLEGFWAAVWEFFDIQADGDRSTVLATRAMPGARWFPDVRLNLAEHAFRGKDDADTAILYASDSPGLGEWTWGELRRETTRIREGLVAAGVGPGDRVAALLPNTPEAVAAFLATASLGAIWSSSAPELGARAVIDRFAQIEPKVMLVVDGYRYGGREHDCAEKVGAIAAELSGARLVRFGYLDGSGWEAGFLGDGATPLEFRRVTFDEPLWVLYSSGTTGLPKPIVHGHGGVLLELYKQTVLQFDVQRGDRVFWFTTTSWMMWNFLVGMLLTPASIVLYDGSPAGEVLWDLTARAEATLFGTSASYITACMKDGVEPRNGRDLAALRTVGSTGSPLSREGFRWIYDQLGPDVWLVSSSGGTDVCTAFLGGAPTLPVYSGELQARSLGCDVQAWDPDGRPLTGEVGELVIVQPMPSMPVGLWGDADGSRYRESYFDTYPGVWRHGDWVEISERGTAIIHGRSDATINRGGVRMGTSEIYRAVLALDEVIDALVVEVDGWMPLFVVLRDGLELGENLRTGIARRIRTDCSPRHVPNAVFRVPAIPRTVTGKTLEVPIKRILAGADPESTVSRGALADPAALDWFVRFAATSARHSQSNTRGG
jgi:acetoacetyl-CoA synthetase